ncbi:MAG: aspartate aminotransferase family protein [Candidatus Ancaeobacter aquaticus]|nr:aspartate aminotransferase family protein [Candidatus Ancaeobacter aquaticus]
MNKTINLYDKYVLNTYTKTPIVFVKGKGSYLWDDKGNKYLDFFPGWGVSGLGHCPKAVVSAIKKQVDTLMHISNNYYNELQGKLAEIISKQSFGGKVFFCNSGAEANEAAIKLVRKYGSKVGRYEVITMLKSFHGRTLAAVSATGQKQFHDGFRPLVPGFRYVKFGDIEELKRSITDKTIAIMLEPIQGEGGINYAGKEYYTALRKLCDKNGILLIFDEVQTGMGRTGKMFCYQNFDVVPDVMTLAKMIGGGMPIGAMVVKNELANVLGPGTHATTFGGSPLACSAALAVFDTIKNDKLMNNAKQMGSYLRKQLEYLADSYPIIRDVRGLGLMIGVELNADGVEIAKACTERGLLINCTNQVVLRIMPALNVKKSEIDSAVSILDGVLGSLQ